MVGNFQKKELSKSWTHSRMQAAVDAVINNGMGCYRAANLYLVPQTTLERHVKRQKERPELRLTSATPDVDESKRVFSKKQEQLLVSYLTTMKYYLFGLTTRDIRALAFQLASRYGQNHPFNKEEKLAGNDWVCSFQKRYPEISLKKKEASATVPSASATVPSNLNKAEVDTFFDRLEEFARQGIAAESIYNADEVGITFNNLRTRVKKSRRRFCVDNGAIVTAEICFSAAGSYMPPTVVFPSAEVQEEFKEGLPAGASVSVHPSGDFTNELYFDWFKKFVVFSKASVTSPVLLLVDGHSTYIKNLDLLDYATEHGVSILCFPLHGLNRLEPIGMSFVKTLSSFYEDEARFWLQTHPGEMITASQVSPLFGSAYTHTATRALAGDSFAKTGLWPVVRLAVIHEDDFLSEFIGNPDSAVEDTGTDLLTEVIPPKDYKPRRSYLSKGTREAGSKAGLPFRVAAPLTPILKSRTFTSALRASNKTNDGSKIVKKDSDEKKGSSASPNSNSSPPSGDIQDNYNPSCLYCNDFYSNAMEGWWLRCEQCLRWAHHSCAGFDDEDDHVCSHICKMCA